MSSVQPYSAAVAEELNILRSNPPAYAEYVKIRLGTYIDEYVYVKTSGHKIKSNEGTSVVNECIELLLNTEPLPLVSPCIELEQAAVDHGKDIEENNLTSHTGSDGSTVSDRVRRYGNFVAKVGENLRYGEDLIRDIVVSWLIDDGQPTRGHRKNVLNPDFLYVGAAVGNHFKYHTFCCAAFAHKFD